MAKKGGTRGSAEGFTKGGYSSDIYDDFSTAGGRVRPNRTVDNANVRGNSYAKQGGTRGSAGGTRGGSGSKKSS